jgi:zinc transport system substrate-binding protein
VPTDGLALTDLLRIDYRFPPSRFMTRLLLPLIGVLLTLVAAGDATAARPPALRVAVSIPPQAWLVREVAGDRVEVITALPSGSSPATYAPTDAEVSRLMRARLYFRIGVPFERGPWFQALKRTARADIVDQRAGVRLRRLENHHHHHDDGDHDHDHSGDDPHVWLSPRLLKIQARTVTAALAEADPEHREAYEKRLALLLDRLDELHAALERRLAPFRGRSVFVFHPAWGYFTDDYGLKQEAIEIEGKQPADHELTEIQRRARAAGARVIFVQPQISGRAAEAVARAIGGRVESIDPLAPDVAANLTRVAERFALSFGPPGREGSAEGGP